jgi:hypothetical protein
VQGQDSDGPARCVMPVLSPRCATEWGAHETNRLFGVGWRELVVLGIATGAAHALTSDSPSKSEIPAPGKALDEVWPKPVGDFLRGIYLQRADVVLTRRTGDIASTIIRWATNSAFSHAAMVYTGAQFDQGIRAPS